MLGYNGHRVIFMVGYYRGRIEQREIYPDMMYVFGVEFIFEHNIE